nr:MAG TPA: Major capsid protein [Microviridae sp.]
MTLVKNIGKNTLGDNNKTSVRLHSYNMSNHDLSFVFRNTQSPGTLVPFMKIVAQKGDVFDIQLINKTLTHPTVGPLFGSYKLQHFIFTCPIRLYNSWLHNNRTGIGMKMSDIKFPTFSHYAVVLKTDENGKPIYEGKMTNPSSLINYLGFKGTRLNKEYAESAPIATSQNAMPYLMYWDIFKNYFANKQEENFYYVGVGETVRNYTVTLNDGKHEVGNGEITRALISATTSIQGNGIITDWTKFWENCIITLEQTANGKKEFTGAELATTTNTATITLDKLKEATGGTNAILVKITNNNQNGIKLVSVPLENLDKIRDEILTSPGNQVFNINGAKAGLPFSDVFGGDGWKTQYPQYQLAVKTYDSDIYQNWVNTDWIDGSNGINEITAVNVSDGKLTMDALNLAQKVYNMLNRIAISGGTYRDWLETVYTTGQYIERPETPIFEGGMTQYIEFDEVVSQSSTEEEPLGTLAGRGKNTRQKGSGRIHFKVSEPSYVIGICAITPMIDYSQGNDWDIMALQTMDDLHKPALDGIGYQDSLNQYRAWWTAETQVNSSITNTAAGKTVAWIDYMTNFNKTFGNFAAGQSESFMCLNRNYEENETLEKIEDLTTYIDPSKHNEIFADTNIDAMNFWVQTAVNCQVRRCISAKQIPNL